MYQIFLKSFIHFPFKVFSKPQAYSQERESIIRTLIVCVGSHSSKTILYAAKLKVFRYFYVRMHEY